MKKRLMLIALIAIAVWTPLAIAADSLESVESAIGEKWDKVTSAHATLNLSADFPMNVVGALLSGKEPDPTNTAVGKLAAVGVLDFVKKGPLACTRLEANPSLNGALKAHVLFVSDGANGNFEWSLFNKIGHKQVDAQKIVIPGGKALFELTKGLCTLSIADVPDGGDKAPYVLDAKLIAPDARYPVSKLRFWIDRETGLLAKCEAFDIQGGAPASLTVSDVAINQPIADSLFQYVPPPEEPDTTKTGESTEKASDTKTSNTKAPAAAPKPAVETKAATPAKK
jgi:hypothetical protein